MTTTANSSSLRGQGTPKTVKKYKPDTVRAAFKPFWASPETDDGEIKAFCPICEDPVTSNSPSAAFNPEQGIWNCLKGNHGGSIYDLSRDLKKVKGWDIRAESLKYKHQDPEYKREVQERFAKAGKSAAPLPTPEQIERWNTTLMSSPTLLKQMTEGRGLSQQSLIEAEIGHDGQRFTIPVYDKDGNLQNVRRYKPNAGSQDKMLNTPGRGQARLYGLEDIEEFDTVVLSEGEMDRLLGKQMLNPEGIGVVTHTAGAATFRPQWGQEFQNKRVYICYDVDQGGKDGSAKAKRIIAPYADAVYIVKLPLSHKGADLTDYLHKEGYSVEEFKTLMKESEEGVEYQEINNPIPDSGLRVSLEASMDQKHQNDILELVVSVAGKQQEPYTAPKRILATCDMSKGAVCELCPLSANNGSKDVEIRPDDEEVFRFVESTEDRRKKLIKEVTGARCSDRVTFEVPEDYHLEELLVQPSVDDRRDDETQQPVRRTVFGITEQGRRAAVNEKRRLVGRNVTDPKTGKLKFMTWKSEPLELDIDKFKLDEEMHGRLMELFSPAEDQLPLDKCLEIAKDLANNVTHIYGREWLHVAYDLVWHSVLSFKVRDQLVAKGWLEMLVVGDTRTGKSEVATRLVNHYRSGVMLSCEGMSFAGIVGGVQQIDNRWHMTWGAVPMNDRRLVVLDEMSGLAEKNIVDQMSSIRSSGIAQVTKIAAEQTSARTRMIWITNPADGSMLADNPEMGMSAMRSVVPNNEDIARFDFAIAAMKGDVPDDVINSGFAFGSDPTYPAEECEALIKWAWSLTRNDVIVSDAAANAANDAAKDLGSRYVSDPPLIQSENVRFKVLRIAAAIAARTFSCDRNGKLVVSREHVTDAVRFLDAVYGPEAMGYARKSRRVILDQQRAKERRLAAMTYLKQNEDTVLHALKAVGGNTISQNDFKNYGMMDNDQTGVAVKRLIDWRMLSRKSRGDMALSRELIGILREIQDEEDGLL